jgi:uncharacterized phiE125 gp8 family phage protein
MVPSGLVIATEPAEDLLTLAEAKDHMRVTNSEEDDYIDKLILATRYLIEAKLGRVLVTQTWDAYFNCFPSGDTLRLPFGQLQSVGSVKYTDSDDTETTYSAANYDVVTWEEPGAVVLKNGIQWPTVTLRPAGGVVVRFTAGYGAVADIPENLIHAAKIAVEDLYQNRESVTLPERSGIEVLQVPVIDSLLLPYRLPSC